MNILQSRYICLIFILYCLQQVNTSHSNDLDFTNLNSNLTQIQSFQIRDQDGDNSSELNFYTSQNNFEEQDDPKYNLTSKDDSLVQMMMQNNTHENRILTTQAKELDKRDNSCHFSCSTCVDDQYYSCTSCFGSRVMKYTFHEQVSICKCPINSVDEGPGMCSHSSNKNLELAIKALFSCAFGVNLFTSFVVWNPMYFLGFTEFAQSISQLAYINKFNVLNFDEISDFLSYSHIDKIFTLHQISTSKSGRDDNRIGQYSVKENPKIYLNDKDHSFIVNAFIIMFLHAVAWIISIFGRNNIKYKHLLSISTPLIIYLITFSGTNFLALFQFTDLHFETPVNTFGFIFALISISYIFAFTGYIFYYISIKQVLNEEKQTSKLKQYINELHELILNNPGYDLPNDEDDDSSSKQSHKTNSKLNQGKQNGVRKDNDAHSMILKNLDNSPSQKDNSPSQKDNSPSQKKDNLPSHYRNCNFPNPKHQEADSTYFDNESPIKQKKTQLMSELNSKNISCANLMANNNKDEEELKVISLDRPNQENVVNQNEKEKSDIRSIEEGLENNNQMVMKEEELKLKLIEQEFILQQYRSKFYLFFILLKQSNLWQRGFYSAIILRKLLFSIINIYVFDNPQTQMVLILVINLIYFLFCSVSQPFKRRLHNIFFFFFEGITLLCFIIYTFIASDDVSNSSQITAIKAIASFIILGFIIYIILGLTGVVAFILTLINGPKNPLSEKEDCLKENEDKKSGPDEEEDDYSMEKKKEQVKQKGEIEMEENSSPQQRNAVIRSDSPPILQQDDNILSYNKNKLIRPFKSQSIVLLEADEEDDDDYNINKKATNQPTTSIQPFSQPQPQDNNDERPDDHIRRPVKYQLTQIRKQAEELFNQQKQLFEKNREKRIAKTMIIESGQNKFSITENDNIKDQFQRDQILTNDDRQYNNLTQGNADNNGVNIMNRRQFDQEMSFHKNPSGQPYSFRNADGGDTTGRRILDDNRLKSSRLNRQDDDYNSPNISTRFPSHLNSQRENEQDQNQNSILKKSILNLNKPHLMNSVSQGQLLGRNNNSFYNESLIRSGNGLGSEYQTPNNLTPREKDNQNLPDTSERYSPELKNRDFNRDNNQKKITFTPIKIESFGPKSSLISTISHIKEDNDDDKIKSKSFMPGSQSDLDNQNVSQKFSFKLKSMRFSEKFAKDEENNQQNKQEINNRQQENETQKESDSIIFSKPFRKSESKYSRSQFDDLESPVKIGNNKLHLLSNDLNSSSTQAQSPTKNKVQDDVKEQKINQINKDFNPTVPIAEAPNQNQEDQQIINLEDSEDDSTNKTHNIHNESYIPYDPDLKIYENQMNNIPERRAKNKAQKSLIVNTLRTNNKKLNSTQIYDNKQNIIQEKSNEKENNQSEEDDYNNKKQTPGAPFQ